jgi:hypothetical protein
MVFMARINTVSFRIEAFDIKIIKIKLVDELLDSIPFKRSTGFDTDAEPGILTKSQKIANKFGLRQGFSAGEGNAASGVLKKERACPDPLPKGFRAPMLTHLPQRSLNAHLHT